ncbi:hypothetical protein [Roseovarius sp. Pro17]|uniref:hypothetical protein n=1 Tax=Roseovarius sp. Pro17 TaxID=3108175 RepID=UPI002D7A1F6C|nr:hypothetical protein [Roseovarius sp. Pro17]
MRTMRHISALALAALILAGCATTSEMEGYVGRSISEAMLDYGPPDDVFLLTDGRRAYQWEIRKDSFRPAPQPTIGVGIGIGRGRWGGGITTVNTSYVPYSKTCRYTLISDKRGNDWVVSGYRKPTPGCA